MKKAIIEKMKLPLSIWQKIMLDGNGADFQEIEISARTGNRQISGSVSVSSTGKNIYEAVLPGENYSGTAEQILTWLINHMSEYDECSLILRLFTHSQMLTVDRKGVNLQPRYVDEKKKDVKKKLKEDHHIYGTSDKRKYRIKIDEATELLRVLGIVDQQGRLKNDKFRKYQQIDRFVELAEPIILQLFKNEGHLAVYDLACGKSYLSFVLNYYIREKLGRNCTVTGIDISDSVIETSAAIADQLNWRNMNFKTMDLRDFSPSDRPDLCISLHACDTATDMALAAAVKSGSQAILAVPCCQRELLANNYKMSSLRTSVMSSGILRARLADLITDGMRLLLLRSSGYDAEIIEYISPLETPKNLMIRAVYTGRADREAWTEYKKLRNECGVEITLANELKGFINKQMDLIKKEKTLITMATGNADKVDEIREIITSDLLKWQTMRDAGFFDEIIEDGTSYIENALIKARSVHQYTGGWVIADDSGLSVDVLDGAPGIYSARFAGEEAGYNDKIACLHDMLKPWPPEQWTAAFVCAIALIGPDGREWTVQAESAGMIAQQASGENGFGYDPIFYVPEFNCTMAEMSPEQKHSISHRGRALRKIMEIINEESLFDV